MPDLVWKRVSLGLSESDGPGFRFIGDVRKE